MHLGIVLLLLSLFGEWQVAEAECRKKLCADSPGITFEDCKTGTGGSRGNSSQGHRDCTKIECSKEYVFEKEESAWFEAPSDVEYIAITDIDIKEGTEVTIHHLTDAEGKCKILKLTPKANDRHKVIIKLKPLSKKFKISATKPTATLRFKCNKARDCVEMNNERIRKMVRGKITAPNEFPFMARLEVLYSNTERDYSGCNKDGTIKDSDGIWKNCNNGDIGVKYKCGGSIINNRWILSAAHCVVRIDRDSDNRVIYLIGVFVHLGDHMISGPRDKTKEKMFWVSPKKEVLHIHDDYPASSKSDIALLKLDGDIDADKSCRYPICLAPSNMDDLIGCEVQAAGWGRISETETSDKLRKQKNNEEFKIVETTKCHTNSPLIYCYGHSTTNPYKGDSGGPVFCDSANDFYYQVGIIESVTSITEKTPSSCVKVTKFLKWINDRAGLLP